MDASQSGRQRIIDLSTNVAGPFGAKLFADYGADVIKVESPRVGDPARRTGPFFHDDPHLEKSLLFMYLNNNKRGITLDIRTAAGRDAFRSLIESADALIENCAPGYLSGLGLGYKDLENINPQLVVTSVTSFGQSGPYSGYAGNDLVHYAMSGLMYASGAYDREPLKHGHPQSLYMGGMTAAYATSAALFGRSLIGRGQHVDLSLQEVVASHHYPGPTRYAYTGVIERRASKVEGGSLKGTRFEGIVPASDGYIGPSTQKGRQRPPFSEYAALLGRPDIDDPKFATPQLRNQNAQELDDVILPILREWSKFDYFNTTMSDDWVAGVVQTPEDLINCPQLEERDYWAEIDHPVIGKIKVPGEVFRLPESPWSLRSPAPLLGQHNEDVLCGDLGYTRQDLVLLRQQGVI
ncbi:MAG: CoA transferase [Dehalococcoidia bacterium]|jgi:crotonobetainyl-CoA:carnitine CoA-transferase CaiB-like acyl-CoA transferase|nr:CoA transferase [Dehalococcoidia bacterium]